MTKHIIALVSDYFYPSFGGIETHIEMLALNLVKKGHKVIIITHKYPNTIGVSYFKGIKVYYLNLPVIAMNTTFPTFYTNFFLFSEIFTKESIEIVHGHQTMSNLAVEALFHAKTFNLKTVLTEHSLFEVGGFENIVVNSIVKFISNDIDSFICVSYTTKINLMDRLGVESERVHVVPNGIVTEIFYSKEDNNRMGGINLENRVNSRNEKSNMREGKRAKHRNNRMIKDHKKSNENRELNFNDYQLNNQIVKDHRKVNNQVELNFNDYQLNNQIVKDQRKLNNQVEFNSIHYQNIKEYSINLFIPGLKEGDTDKENSFNNLTHILTNNEITIKVAIVSRFVKRKGVDLLIRIIPKMCKLDKRFVFIVVGDGPKRDEIEQMVDKFELHNNIILLGALDHKRIPYILRECDIFLNTSLTESFCMAILEASSCGLQVVSTNVGGIHEVLPEEMITLTSLEDKDVIRGLIKATEKKSIRNEIDLINRNVYSWPKIANKTLKIYETTDNRVRKGSGFITRLLYFIEGVLLYMEEKLF